MIVLRHEKKKGLNLIIFFRFDEIIKKKFSKYLLHDRTSTNFSLYGLIDDFKSIVAWRESTTLCILDNVNCD